MVIGSMDRTVPPTWDERCAVLGRALSSIPPGRSVNPRHEVSLALAGELLHRDVVAEAVPAIVQGAALAAGWANPEHHRKNAEDTVRRHLNGRSVRRDVPPSVVPALDRVTDRLAPPEVDVGAEQQRLRRALAEGGDGLTLVRAPCGLGKTRASEDVAADRAAADKRTTISVPTNELAEQVVGHLRARGVLVLRVYGPASVRGPHDGWECRYRGAAAALAAGGQSIRWELCEGRKREPCTYRDECRAVDGAEGPEDARVVVGNHGLIGELDRATGQRGLLVVDEPPQVIEDEPLTADDLAEAALQLDRFEYEAGRRLAPGLALARAWLEQAPLGEPHRLAEVEAECPELDELLERAGALDVASAAAEALSKRQKAPPILRREIIWCRRSPGDAQRLGRASRTLQQVHRALTQDDVVVTVSEHHETRRRTLSVTGVDRQLYRALRREGRAVVMAADVDLYRHHYREVVGYDPPLVELRGRPRCAVRRVQLEVRTATRSAWQRTKPSSHLQAALAIAREGFEGDATYTPKVAVVTFKWLTSWVRSQAPGVDVGHYGALRGLDHWKHHDAIVTLGDPRKNLDGCARRRLDVEADARAELEQAHGRARLQHRDSPCTLVHVGAIVPGGWEEPIERYQPEDLRRDERLVGELATLVPQLGGSTAVGQLLGVDRRTVNRWLTGERGCPPEVVADLRARATSQGGTATCV